MNDPIMERYYQAQQEQAQAVIPAFEEPDKLDREYVRNLYESLISGAKKSIQFMQEDLAHLTRLRDKYPQDLELGQLIWDNIELTNQCILEERKNLREYRQAIAS